MALITPSSVGRQHALHGLHHLQALCQRYGPIFMASAQDVMLLQACWLRLHAADASFVCLWLLMMHLASGELHLQLCLNAVGVLLGCQADG